jgi:hypothetical protein
MLRAVFASLNSGWKTSSCLSICSPLLDINRRAFGAFWMYTEQYWTIGHVTLAEENVRNLGINQFEFTSPYKTKGTKDYNEYCNFQWAAWKCIQNENDNSNGFGV